MGPFWANTAAGLCVLIALGVSSVARSQEVASPALELGEMTFVVSQGAENEVVLVAEHARVDTDENLAHLKTVHVVLASDRETPGLDMRCERGVVDMETSDFDAEGNVRGITGDGKHFRTERLRYKHGPGLVSTQSPVDIRDDAGTYKGVGGFRYYVRENRFQLNRAATVVGQ
jgi:LPS export ABC transporter protein LptC